MLGEFVDELRAIASDVSELNAEIRGQVTLGMIGTAGRWVVPLLLEELRESYRHINLRISEGTNSALEPRLVNGQLDLAVLAWPVLADELTRGRPFHRRSRGDRPPRPSPR